MADTQRSVATILGLLADNVAGDISPQDLRDAFVSWRPGHGQLYVAAADAAAETIAGTVNYYEVTTPVWTLSAGAHLFDESTGNGQLTYTGAVDVVAHIACSISMTCGSNNQVTHWRLGVNGTSNAASEVQRKIGTGADVGSTALHLITTLSAGDYISLFVRNATGANNVTLEVANLEVVTMPA